ncbi:Allophanate hydrolase 2 subunit 1 [Pseudonocardia sp. Ae168_Ps1]|uniref:5-oxoprolinase subunit B family protein n=1 Tax=unclassified Pseudonocardia TaxID=2619320 RepID=UPI00094B50E3|nr:MULTISPECIES: allophanate hydrolase subunit 1 [unclassified Pseudonocardia]OLL75325.1 Allophanate hydrolase 2 subunit 1 [Pseudonocardia sp. Ae150A_Ps1]OLL81320.1 Allophanate hydrolase 2 subunit 1 [Pseudonocardia sp. Ae168_Ps1]OLL84567.1 Allophanate hydrolase 2 subunit 1 [Pseudonocardia sp. Ae263_Ps1]OLL95414.1 Allophanate hydrolase 2 subunit 1 [Pseudonocardia sp. Ae356_Ps1]
MADAAVRPCGSRALLFEVPTAAEVAAIVAAVRAAGLSEVTELVPAARTVLVEVAPGASTERVREVVRDADPATTPPRTGTVHTIPVVYDGADLRLVAETAGIDVDEVVALHSGAEYTVDFCGFAPGFGYLSGLPEPLRQPRLESSRTAVPAGSVGIADVYSCVYPRRSPGGWRLIGRTDTVLFDPSAERPALFTPGGRVRFEAR